MMLVLVATQSLGALGLCALWDDPRFRVAAGQAKVRRVLGSCLVAMSRAVMPIAVRCRVLRVDSNDLAGSLPASISTLTALT